MNNEPEVACERKQKHVILDRAIRRLKESREHANNLLCEIRQKPEGPTATGNDDIKSLTPSLQEVLEGGPDRIDAFCNDLDSIVNEIRELIF